MHLQNFHHQQYFEYRPKNERKLNKLLNDHTYFVHRQLGILVVLEVVICENHLD